MDAGYTVAIYKAEEGGFWAKALELPGCASQGETLDEVTSNIRDAIRAWLEAALEDNDEIPSPPYMTMVLWDEGLRASA